MSELPRDDKADEGGSGLTDAEERAARRAERRRRMEAKLLTVTSSPESARSKKPTRHAKVRLGGIVGCRTPCYLRLASCIISQFLRLVYGAIERKVSTYGLVAGWFVERLTRYCIFVLSVPL